VGFFISGKKAGLARVFQQENEKIGSRQAKCGFQFAVGGISWSRATGELTQVGRTKVETKSP